MVTNIVTNLFKVIACHMIGDFVFQTDYIAKNKEKNRYIMFVHCFLYLVSFAVVFGMDMRLIVLFVTHFVIDELKARYKKIDLKTDQTLHYIIGLMYLV